MIGDDSSKLSAVNSKMEGIVPVLMDMLDARDSTARAVVLLVAEFFALYPFSVCLLVLFGPFCVVPFFSLQSSFPAKH